MQLFIWVICFKWITLQIYFDFLLFLFSTPIILSHLFHHFCCRQISILNFHNQDFFLTKLQSIFKWPVAGAMYQTENRILYKTQSFYKPFTNPKPCLKKLQRNNKIQETTANVYITRCLKQLFCQRSFTTAKPAVCGYY